MLITLWNPDSSVDELLSWTGELNLDPVVLCDGQDAAQALTERGVTSISGSFLTDVEGTHHQFSLALVPGDIIAIPEDGSDPDWRHVLHTGPYLKPGGVLGFVVRRSRLIANRRWFVTLLQGYRDIRVAEYDDEHFVLMAIRRGARSKSDSGNLAALLEIVEGGNQEDLPAHTYPLQGSHKGAWFRSKFFDPVGMEAYAKKLPWGSSALTDIIGWNIPEVTPVLPLRASHLGAVIAAGAMGTIRVQSPTTGHDVIMRGRTLRRERENMVGGEEDSNQAESVKIGDFVTEITMLDLTTRDLVKIDPTNPAQMKNFLDDWGGALAKHAQSMYPVAYDPSTMGYREILHPYLADVLDEPLNIIGQGNVLNLSDDEAPSMRSSQRHVVAAILLKLLGQEALCPSVNREAFSHLRPVRNFLFSGQTAVGKTIMSLRLLLALVLHYGKKRGLRMGSTGWPLTAFVTTAANVSSVVSEVKLAAPLLQPRVVERYADLKKVLDESEVSPVPLVMVIPRSMLRMVQKIEPAVIWGEPPYTDDIPNITCPSVNCRKSIEVKKSDAKRWTPERLTAGTIKVRGMRCASCGAALWQETHGPYSLALAMKREFKKRDLTLLATILDEVHEDRGKTNQGQSMAWLTYLSRHTVGMTGTIYGGTPDTIFSLLYRLLPGFRKVWGYHEGDKFANRYGSWRQRRKEDGGWMRRVYLPGISPELIANLLNYAAFFTMSDAGFDMPARVDMPLEVPLSAAEAGGMEKMKDAVKAGLQAEGNAKHRRVAAPPRQMQMVYAAASSFHLPFMTLYSPGWKCPSCRKSKVDEEPCDHDWLLPDTIDPTDGMVVPQLDPAWRSSKEDALVELIRQEAQEGRTCLVYMYHTGKFGLLERMQTVLESAGLRVLNTAGVATRKLQKTINMAAFEGVHAVLVNPARCGTGTNLTGTPTIIWYQPVWSVFFTTQGTERSYRPTQTQSVKVVYMASKGTAEAVVLARVVEKMVSLFITAGIDHSGMAMVMDAVGHVKSFHELMIDTVSEHIDVDLAALFEDLKDAVEYDKSPVGNQKAAVRHERRVDLVNIDLEKAEQLAMF